MMYYGSRSGKLEKESFPIHRFFVFFDLLGRFITEAGNPFPANDTPKCQSNEWFDFRPGNGVRGNSQSSCIQKVIIIQIHADFVGFFVFGWNSDPICCSC